MADSCGAAKRQRIQASLQATGVFRCKTRREYPLGRGISASPSSNSHQGADSRRASGRCQISRLAATAYGGPTRRDGVRRWAERGYMPRGELTRLAKAHDFAAAPSGATLGWPLSSRWAPPTTPPPPIRHPPPVAGVGSPTCFAVTAPSAATLRPDSPPAAPADTSWQRLLPIDGS